MAGAAELNRQLVEYLRSIDFVFVVSSPKLPDCPVIYASPEFYSLTGYTQTEVLGRNCRFLQGCETSRQKVHELRDSLREERPCQVLLLNYKKCGEPFWNLLAIRPIHDAFGGVDFYVGVQTDVTAIVQEQRGGDALPSQCSPTLDAVEQALKERAMQVGACPDANGKLRALAASARQAALPTSLLSPLARIQQSFVLSDPSLPGTPIVHASDSFLEMTGYSREEVVGRNCKFLQGAGTSCEEVQRIRVALSAQPPRPVTVTLLNYKKDGTPFWNQLHIAPIRSACGKVMFYAGVQLDVSESKTSALAAPPPSRSSLDQNAIRQKGAVGAVRVAVRSLGPEGLRRSGEFQDLSRTTTDPAAATR